MSFLTNIRNQPHAKKIRLIWMCVGVAVIILLALWAITWRYHKNIPRDTKLLDTIDRGINDYKNNYDKPIQ